MSRDIEQSRFFTGMSALVALQRENPDLPAPGGIGNITDLEARWFCHDLQEAITLMGHLKDPKLVWGNGSNFPVEYHGTIAGVKSVLHITEEVALVDPIPRVETRVIHPLLRLP